MALPLWKIRRELARLRRQVIELPGDLHNFAFGTRNYDRTLAGEARRYDGRLAAAPRVAIFVIFPSLGLQPSHLRTLSYFRAKGYAVAVVSNLPLSEADRAQVLEHCWRYIERPNFGYDFGAYREGILDLGETVAQLDRLVLINDSTWFPLPGARDWLDDVEALGADFVGAASHFGAPRPEIEAFRSMTWNYAPNHRNFHYGSFALCMRPAVLRDRGFVAYWRRLRLADKKKQTVRRGEIGLTQWVLSRGFSHGATFDIAALDRALEKLDPDRLLAVARNLIIPELPRLSAVVRQVTSEPTPAAPDLVKLILLAVARQGASYALAVYAIQERGFPFLKKSPVWLSEESAAITLRLLEGMPGGEDIAAEARKLRDSRRAKPPASADGAP